MKKQLFSVIVALGGISGVAMAQAPAGNEPAAVQQAIKKQYPDAQTSLVNTRDEGGVQVYDVRVAPPQGQPFTVVATNDGQIIESVWDFGGNTQGLSPLVSELTQGIWKTPPTDVRQEIGIFYWVTIGGANSRGGGLASEAGSNVYELRLDGAGRLVDMRAPSQLHRENWQSQPDAPQDVTQKLSQIATSRYQGAKIVAVKQVQGAPGFFEVRFTRNGDGWMRADQNGNISDEAYTVPVKQLPQAVQQTLNDTFKGDRVIWAAHDEQKFYQVKETVGSEQVVIRVQPDGEVLSVHRDRNNTGTNVVPAAQRQKGQRNNNNQSQSR